MTHPPSLPAIRERVRAFKRARREWPTVYVLIGKDRDAALADLTWLLRENDRLTAALAALSGTALQQLADASPCWCPHVREHADPRRVEHTEACRAARAALGEAG